MRIKRGLIAATAAAAILGLASPAYAQAPTKKKSPVTAAQCKQGGGTVSMNKCSGGTYDGAQVQG